MVRTDRRCEAVNEAPRRAAGMVDWPLSAAQDVANRTSALPMAAGEVATAVLLLVLMIADVGESCLVLLNDFL